MAYETIKAEPRGRVGLITLNRPKAMNALSQLMMREICQAAADFDGDAKIGAIVLTGSEKAFAAGADVKEMEKLGYSEAYLADLWRGWDRLTEVRKPLIAAVSGYALGGGCEVAAMCDIVIAAENAKFGQPEITLGILPGMGGTQRLARSIGKAKTMDLVLTGRLMDAAEAESCGLVSRVVPTADLLEDALKIGEKIADFSLPAVMSAKESVLQAFETPLDAGLKYERRLFHATFATDDQSEGMAAFVQKRSPQFKNR
ncbi:short chain enoyl-CoA hydratase [Fulvimarina manganoxydans]|uniref:enoyl-CoA hydratase n=1 Tax=Fulvimarina manganoxydans TaxID=937218 RepID=A0A1W2BCV3_9HYPH|nr:enoyl-CoA hydratase [Fulvimarina manganoxydans]MCK5933340.1 enoyl-CoA hydratase [Fulvimarina manganoxydans]MEE2951354.1 enoyl-CoA hydratase [Pseudomonadota bacterium]SMC70739.1 short chain enoyl-CoA hydratase [Fulvimarina manganoxydans]